MFRQAVLAVVGAAAFATFSGPLDAQSQRSLEVEHFNATIKVEPSGWVDVGEEIQVRFTGSWNGIFRTIPVEYRTPQGFSYKLRLEDISVTGPDGKPYEFRSSRERHYRKLKIRVPDANDATRSVFVHYRIPNALKFWDDYDELYWNVTGDEWEMPIRSATAMVILPDGASGVRTSSWTGGYGATENAATSTTTDAGVYFETEHALSYREGLTVAVAWNPGVVARPTLLDKVADFLRANWLFLFPILSLVLMWRIWSVRGRDPARLAIAPQYEPTDGLTPSEAGTLIDNRPDMRDITATLVDLAVRGYLRIEETQPDDLVGKRGGASDFTLVPLEPPPSWTKLRVHEREVLRGIFDEVGADDLPGPVKMSGLQHEFYRHLPAVKDGIFGELIRRGFYRKRPDKTQGGWMVGGAIVLAFGFGGGVPLAVHLGMAPLTAILAAVGTALPVFLFGFFMPARTVAGARALERLLGFEDFLDRVESDRYKRMITSPDMFERYLPYAMAFGVERKWAAAFDGLYTEPPSWYVGTWDGGFRTSALVHSMGYLSATATTAMASGPRSSGGSGFSGGGAFSSGGGFSGGGFGGGGGGGW